MMDFWARIDALRDRWDVLRHPFIRRWTEGGIDAGELTRYAAQYRHAVAGVAAACAAAARVAPDVAVWDELETHACEERHHIALWDAFAVAVGADPAEAATERTRRCVAAWAPPRDRSLVRTLISLYVIEAAEPAVAAAKREALARWYGIDDPRATAYFDEHERLDPGHAEHSRALITWARRPHDDAPMLAEAEGVLRARWAFLDGMEQVA